MQENDNTYIKQHNYALATLKKGHMQRLCRKLRIKIQNGTKIIQNVTTKYCIMFKRVKFDLGVGGEDFGVLV